MLDKLIAIYDSDVLYASRLMEYFKKSAWKGFEIVLFTTKENLISFLEYQAVEILLYGGDDLPREKQSNNVKHIFLLSVDKRLPKDNYQYIYKYQPASKISTDVLSLYTKLEDSKGEGSKGNVCIVSVFSPITAYEKIEFAWSLAKHISSIKKVLFIPLELLPTAHLMQQEEKGESLSEFLYYLKESKSDLIEKMKSFLNYYEKLSYLSGLTHGFDLLSINKDDIVRFIDCIKEHTDYEIVIFYIGIYTEASMEILQHSNEICVISRDENYEEHVRGEWERQMDILGYPVQKLRYHLIRLPVSKSEEHTKDQTKELTKDKLSKMAIEFAELII